MDLGDNTSLRSHEMTQPQPRPVASSKGRNRVSNKETAPTETTNTTTDTKKPQSRVPCRYYASTKGCRAGETCPFLHVTKPPISGRALADTTTSAPRDAPQRAASQTGKDEAEPANVALQSARAVVSKPVPLAQQADPRGFQLEQVKRRFNPTVSQSEPGTVLVFTLVPSDPDFPFELDGLRCTLTVPVTYPSENARPSLSVTNPEIEVGFRINVQRGFDSLVNQYPNRTLLSLLNELDKNLEAFLTAPKAQTIKITTNAPRSEKPPAPVLHEVDRQLLAASASTLQPALQYEQQQEADARIKRESDVRQLEARLRNIPQFKKSADGMSFNIPLTVPKPARLPVSLRSLKDVTLLVPQHYNLEPCTIKLKGVDGQDAQNVEMIFERHAREEPTLTLMAQINFLSQNMHLMAKEQQLTVSKAEARDTFDVVLRPEPAAPAPRPEVGGSQPLIDEDRPHLQVIPRPPEWDQGSDGSEDESADSESEDYNDSEDDEAEENNGGATIPSGSGAAAPTGNSILLSFPNIELYGIELLEIASLSLTLKCDRCKSTVDAQNIKAKVGDVKTTVIESCRKCSVILSASYTSEPLHANSIKAGHLDLNGCTVSDMLPSVFKPTCSGCSTTYPSPPGVVSVRGETTLAVCRECHQKMTFKIPEVKFLRVSSALASSLPLRQKKKKENLGIVAGTPLPNYGRCSHYRKSHRWFRFSCCQGVFPCDKCHDSQVDPKHTLEFANRQICGYCSREQNYRPEDCGICHASLVGRKGGGFWEGGKGTRDPLRMSRKDPRKYKNRRRDVKNK